VLAAAYVVVGLIPVNRGFAPTPGGVEVSVVSSAVHADVIVPIVHGDTDWRVWLGDDVFVTGWPAGATHLAIGWGDRGFGGQTCVRVSWLGPCSGPQPRACT